MSEAGARAVDPAGAARRGVRALLVTMLAVLAVRIALGEAFPNVLWPDEIFQSLEQAHRLAFGYGVVPWEFRVGSRSWALPGVLAALMRAAAYIHDDPAFFLGAVRTFLVAISMLPVVAAAGWGAESRGRCASIVAAAVVGLWFEAVYMAPKALSEVVAAHLLVGALYLADPGRQSERLAFAGGLLLGCAFALRLHLGPAILLALVWAGHRDACRMRLLLIAFLAPLVGAGLLDAWTWGAPFHSFIAAFRINLLEGKARQFGMLPWAAYGWMLKGVWGAAAVPLLILAGVGARRKPALLALAVVILVTHSAIDHKEWRFIYPAVLLLVVLAALGTTELIAWIRERGRIPRQVGAGALVFAWCGVSLALGARFGSAQTLKTIPPGYSHWTDNSAYLKALAAARVDPQLCGLGFVGVPWYLTGGYAHLHRDVPLFVVTGALPERGPEAYNAWVSVRDDSMPADERHCWPERSGEVCLYRRVGGCRPSAEPTINARLQLSGE